MEYGEAEESNKLIYIVIGLVIVGMIVSFFLFFRPEPVIKPPVTQVVCGNNICEIEENCFDCSHDCKCKSNEYCSDQSKECVVPVCGNGECEQSETPKNCCDDCGCFVPDEICNQVTHKCGPPQVNLSDERLRELVDTYFRNQGKRVSSVGEIRSRLYEGEPAKSCVVTLEGEEDRVYNIIVTETEEIIEIPNI